MVPNFGSNAGVIFIDSTPTGSLLGFTLWTLEVNLKLFLLIPYLQEMISYRYLAVRRKTSILTPLETTKCPRSARSAVQFKKRMFDNKLRKNVSEGVPTL